MKKLMIAAAVAFAAVASQAATVEWTTAAILDHAGVALNKDNGYPAGMDAYKAVMTIYDSTGTEISSDFGAISADKSKTGVFSGKGSIDGPGKNGTYYAQLVISGVAGTAYEGWSLTSDLADFSWDSLASSNLALNFSTGKNFTEATDKLHNVSTVANYGWVNAAPEPTSGLLLLVGLGALALRRRRA